MTRLITAAALSACLGASALAQPAKIDLSKLPAEIKSLQWRDIDWASVNPIDRIRALMLLDDTLEELGAQTTAEADLMSQYIEESNLGPQFAAAPPPADTSLTMQDAQKIAVALLRGPMATSNYATAFSTTDGSLVQPYENMYTTTCARKWTSATEARHQVRAMTQFLDACGKMSGYAAWVPGEVERRTKEADVAAQKRLETERARQQEKIQEDQIRQQQQEIDREKRWFGNKQQAATQVQLALSSAVPSPEINTAVPSTEVNTAVPSPYQGYIYYGGGNYLGGAAAANAWYRDAGYRGVASQRVENRIGGWHGLRR